jgi:hypothetical protein
MIVFLILLIIAAAVVGVYATGNTGTHDVTLWQWHWSAVPDWLPVMVAAAVIAGLFLLYMLYSGLVHGVRVGSMRRRVTTRESTIGGLRRENQRLREENARVRSELRGMEVTPGREMMPANPDGDREPVATAVDRPRIAPPFHAQPTLRERVRTLRAGPHLPRRSRAGRLLSRSDTLRRTGSRRRGPAFACLAEPGLTGGYPCQLN